MTVKFKRLCVELFCLLILAVVIRIGIMDSNSIEISAAGKNSTQKADAETSDRKFSENTTVPGKETDLKKAYVAEENSDKSVQANPAGTGKNPLTEKTENPKAEQDTKQDSKQDKNAQNAETSLFAQPTEAAKPELKKVRRVKALTRNNPAYYNYIDYSEAIAETREAYGENAIPEFAEIPVESDEERYKYVTGLGKQTYRVDNMPKGYGNSLEASANMISFIVPIWKMDSKGEKMASQQRIAVNKLLAESVKCIFTEIYELDIKFPFNYLSGFSYRKVGGSGLMNSKLMSAHSFGVAIDINNGDYDNDYFLGAGNDLRDKTNPYCIPDEVIAIFEKYGWFWGGNFEICSDTMHFQYFGLDFLQYDSEEPFPVLKYKGEGMKPIHIQNLIQRLKKLGYIKKNGNKFTSTVDKAVKAFQTDMGLEPNGIVNYETWVPLINATHDMDYTF